MCGQPSSSRNSNSGNGCGVLIWPRRMQSQNTRASSPIVFPSTDSSQVYLTSKDSHNHPRFHNWHGLNWCGLTVWASVAASALAAAFKKPTILRAKRSTACPCWTASAVCTRSGVSNLAFHCRILNCVLCRINLHGMAIVHWNAIVLRLL